MKVKRNQMKPRRKPAQSRSAATVDCILEASARILIKEGYDRLSTNHIATVAGVSVGSIYQYFGSKESILAEMGDRHIDEMLRVITAKLPELPQHDLRNAIRIMVAAVMEAHRLEPKLHQVLVRELNKLDGYTRLAQLDDMLFSLAENFISSRIHEVTVGDTKLAGFVLVQTIENLTHQGVVHAASIDLFKLQEECVKMLYCYLTG